MGMTRYGDKGVTVLNKDHMDSFNRAYKNDYKEQVESNSKKKMKRAQDDAKREVQYELAGIKSMRPLNDFVIVRATQENVSDTIIIPDIAKERSQKGEVLAVGEGRLGKDNERVPLSVSEGDSVLFAKFGGVEIELSGETLILIRERDIYLVYEPA